MSDDLETVRDIDGLTVRAHVRIGQGALAISSLEISSTAASGITHQMLRGVALGEILADARQRSAEVALNELPPIQVPEPGYVRMTDDFLRDVARVYLEETTGSDAGPGVLDRIGKRFGRNTNTIITWISRARKEGWLGPAARGRIGAEPGPRLIAWIGSVANCDTCHGDPPAGFACRTCGAEGGGE